METNIHIILLNIQLPVFILVVLVRRMELVLHVLITQEGKELRTVIAKMDILIIILNV